jgi:putative PIN family toxin of toxin-antitoxin system
MILGVAGAQSPAACPATFAGLGCAGPSPRETKFALARTLNEEAASIPLLVLDTNVVLDWLAFDDPRVGAMADAIDDGRLRLATSNACLQELRRVLGYTQLGLDETQQALAYARYAARARLFEIERAAIAPELPRCEDPDDQKFLDLAWHARASHLLTRDQALLKLARGVARLGRFRVLQPQEFDPRRRQP